MYRHFPTREALVEAAYRQEVEQLRTSVDDLLATRAADVALRTWMDLFADYVAAKRGMAEALRAVVALRSISAFETRGVLTVALGGPLNVGATAGTVRADVSADDVLASLTGVLLAAGTREQRDRVSQQLTRRA